MAQNLNLSANTSLVWRTERPLWDSPRQSSSFSILGLDLYFLFTVKRIGPTTSNYSNYHLTIQRTQGKEQLSPKCRIFTVLTYSDGRYITSSYTNLENKELLITLTDYENTYNSSMYGQWCVHCTFLTDLPVQLDKDRSEKMCLSNLSDLRLSSPEQNPVFKKAKLVACAPYEIQPGLETRLKHWRSFELAQTSSSSVTLKCGDRTFTAQSSVLSVRSEAFAVMLGKMGQSETGVFNITGIDGEVFDLMLKYLHSGLVPDLDTGTACRLYLAADKYSVPDLKTECSRWMLENLTDSNWLDFLIAADSCSDEKLKDRLVVFVAEILDLMEENAWWKLCKEHTKLAISVLEVRKVSNNI